MLLKRKSITEILQGTPALLEHGTWICINIETNTPWPVEPQPFEFEGHSIWLVPHTVDAYGGLAINRPAGLSEDDAWALLHRALSLLAWMQDAGAVVDSMSGGNLPRMMGRAGDTSSVALRSAFDLCDLQEVPSRAASLALALMREGRGLNHPAYAFLSFFRALEVAIPDGRDRRGWIADALDRIDDHRAGEVLAELRSSVADVGVHLRESGRHAIAHARLDPIINPDDPRDARRLRKERPLLEALAVLAIEEKLGIQTRRKIWREHLYELRGWKAVLGEDFVGMLLSGNAPAEGTLVDLPEINIRLRGQNQYSPFEGLIPVALEWEEERIKLTYRSQSERVHIMFRLHVQGERLEFDINQSIAFRDDGSVGAAEEGKALTVFSHDYFANGELHMWRADTNELLSRLDAFLPVNVFFDPQGAQAALDRCDLEIERRKQASEA